jgi:outer membrane receptor protein involved in Fe transport
VVTSEFLEAFNITDVAEAAAWTVNSQRDVADGTNQAFGTTAAAETKLRGSGVGAPTRNFFSYVVTPDSFNLDRVDFARGPNAVLFGAGGIGGTLNSVTKQALSSKDIHSFRVQLGSYNKRRVTADINRSFAGGRAAIRINLMNDTSNTWRENEWRDKYGISVAAKVNITKRLTFRVEGEMTMRREAMANTAMRDQLSAWDGVTTFSGVPTTLPNQAARAAAGIQGPNNMRWVQNASFTPGTLLNFANLYRTAPAVQNGTLANTSKINGVPIITNGFTLNNTAVVDDSYGIPEDRWANAQRGSPYFVTPYRGQTPLWTSKVPTYEEKGRDLAAYLNYKLGDSLFIELAGDINKGDKVGNTASRRGMEDLYIDIDRTLPNGEVNKNFLHPYTEFMEYRNIRNDDVRNVRAQAIYSKEFDKGRFWNGKMNFSLMGGVNIERNEARARTLLLPLKTSVVGTGTSAKTYTNSDARTWVDNDEYSQYGVYTRIYLDQADKNYQPAGETPFTITNQQTGVSEQITPKWMYDTRRVDNNRDGLRKYKFFQTAANLDLLKNKLVVIGAFRRDFTYLKDSRVIVPGDMPVGWDGNSLIFRPDAPADYYTLTYLPKNSLGQVTGALTGATTVPRTRDATGAQIRQSQYANDRFQDDYNSPALSSAVNTFTVGTVFNLKSWVGLFVNKSRTFSLTPPQTQVDGSLSPSTASEGKDFGIRFNLPNGKLSVSLGKFTSDQERESFNTTGGFGSGGNFKDFYNAIYAAPVIGDLSPTGRNAHDMPAFPDNVYTTRTRHVEGYEADITANLTKHWRLSFNAGKTEGVQSNIAADIFEYVTSHDAIARQILGEAGVLISSTNVASINPLYNDATKINQARVTTAVNAWNTLNGVWLPSVGPGPSLITGFSKYVGNIATDYRFHTGWLKGLRVGGGVNYRGPMILGNHGSDQIADPNNPLLGIDDPTVGQNDYVYSPRQWKTVGSLSYTFKLKNQRSIQLDLNIDNVLNDQGLIYSTAFGGQSTTYVRPRTNISQQGRVTVPGLFSYRTPRNYMLSVKMNF